MEYKDYKTIKIEVNQGVAFVTFDNPPINIINLALMTDLGRFMEEVKTDDGVRVIVFQSADPKFFLAHYDVSLLTEFPEEGEEAPKPTELSGWKKWHIEFRSLPKVTIAKIQGIVGGGGSELTLSMDMRFGEIGKAIFHQAEASLGIIAGGGGTVWLTRLMGRARAMEVMLGLTALTAKEAERYGWINRAIPSDNIDQYVNQLAYTIAYVPAETIKIQKQSMLNAETLPVEKALLKEDHLFALAAGLKETKNRMKTFLDSAGQSRDSELNIVERAEQREKLLEGD